MHVLLLLAVLQVAPVGEPLRTGCSFDDRQIASVVPGDSVEVQSALAGEGPTCYKVNVLQSGQSLTGYVLGESLPSVRDFVDSRERISEAAAIEEARRARLAALAPKPAPEKVAGAADPLISTRFEDFRGRDALGKPVSLSGLKGRVTLVTFWSPQALSPLMQEMPLYLQLHKEGLAAVGVCTNPHADLAETLDDVTLPWPQITDPGGLTARYHVDPRAGKTFVLDENQRIVASGPMGPEIDKAVRKLMDTPEDQ